MALKVFGSTDEGTGTLLGLLVKMMHVLAVGNHDD